jgi:hypothetical protein
VSRASLFRSDFHRASTVVKLRSGGMCEMNTPACTQRAVHVHHRAGRLGPNANDPAMLLHCCLACHEFAHAHPTLSYEKGWLIRRLS